METKALIQSKQFWVAVAQALLAVIAIFMTAYPELQTVGGILVLKSIIDIFLRMSTSTPISGVIKPRY